MQEGEKSSIEREAAAKIIGRVREKEILSQLFDSKTSEFIAVYGRRRVGKTFLIKHLMDSFPCLFFHVTGIQKGSSKEQLEEFAKQIGTTFYQSPSIIPRARWRDAFEDLTVAMRSIPKEQKIVLFLDEFPCMATPRSNLLTALEFYWNRYWVFDDRVKLIVCGSSASWIIVLTRWRCSRLERATYSRAGLCGG
ncbi:MAG: AAA family ATPase [Chlamydiia bacterium]